MLSRSNIDVFHHITPLWRAIENADIIYNCKNYGGFRHFLGLSSILPQVLRVCQKKHFGYEGVVQDILCQGDWPMHGFYFIKPSKLTHAISMVEAGEWVLGSPQVKEVSTPIWTIARYKNSRYGSVSHMRDAVLLRLILLASDLNRKEVSCFEKERAYSPETLKKIVSQAVALGCGDVFREVSSDHTKCGHYITSLVRNTYEQGGLREMLILDDGSIQNGADRFLNLGN